MSVNTLTVSALPSSLPASRKKPELGEDIAFGLQQTLVCWATDFIDPFLAKWIQDKYKTEEHSSTLAHNMLGEVVGDSAAFLAFLGVRKFFPQAIDGLANGVLAVGGGFYDRGARQTLKSWAAKHNIAEDSPEYQQAFQRWKHFQADNFAKSAVVSLSSVVLNVATQKAMGNTHKLSVITGSKLTGAAITMGGMLGLRMVIPKSTRMLDEELSDRYFTPLIHKTQKLFGAKQTPTYTEQLRAEREIGAEIALT